MEYKVERIAQTVIDFQTIEVGAQLGHILKLGLTKPTHEDLSLM
jgi:hypothetical protein